MSIIEIIMAFDFGIKNIGIAIGQKITYTTQPLSVLKSKSGIPNWKKIERIYNEWKPTQLIVGLPLTLDGNEQPITVLAREFAKQLQKRFQISVKMQDERFSTIEARLHYFKRYYYKSLIKIKTFNQIDSIAAAIILESWLNHNHI